MATQAQAEEHRAEVALLTTLAVQELTSVWGDFDSAETARDMLLDLLPQLVSVYGSAAATLGADWYDDLRDESGVTARFQAVPAELPDRGRTDSLAGWGVDPLFQAEPDPDAALERVSGGLQRIVADADRDTVIGSLAEDPEGQGWRRLTRPGECDFCDLIEGRGAVYSAETADFAAHDNCRCLAVPVIGGEPREVKPYTPSQRFETQEERAANNRALREFLAARRRLPTA